MLPHIIANTIAKNIFFIMWTKIQYKMKSRDNGGLLFSKYLYGPQMNTDYATCLQESCQEVA